MKLLASHEDLLDILRTAFNHRSYAPIRSSTYAAGHPSRSSLSLLAVFHTTEKSNQDCCNFLMKDNRYVYSLLIRC